MNAELTRVRGVLRDGRWHTLQEIADITRDPPPGISARIRDLRKKQFGGHVIERRERSPHVWEYRMLEAAPQPVGRPVFGDPESGRL